MVVLNRVSRPPTAARRTPGPSWHVICSNTAWSVLIDDVQLVVSELATNALSHAHTLFRVTLTGLGDSVLLEVFDGSSTGPVIVIARPMDTHGRGVAIVKALSRDWGSTSSPAGGKVVWASFDRPAA